MKGTLFSADFVKDSNGDLRLLELNTDTAFTSASLHHADFSGLINILSASNISEVHVIYKDVFHKNFIEELSQSLHDSSLNVSYNLYPEAFSTIYPTTVTDSDDKFILRLAYDESAIFDSTYCKQDIELLKLFYDNNNSGSIPEMYHSSSTYQIDTLLESENTTNVPDLVVKNITNPTTYLKLYKLIGTGSLSNKYSSFISSSITSDDYVINYYETPNSTKSKSYRSFNIIYGSELNILNLANLEVVSLLDEPSSLTIDTGSGLVDDKHYYEFTTNFPKFSGYGGIFEEEEIVDVDGNAVMVKDTVIGNSYKSTYLEGAPDSDSIEVFTSWSHPGSSLPSGSYVTSSVLVNSIAEDLPKKMVYHIQTEDSSSFRVSANQHMLIYDSVADRLKYKDIYNLDISSDRLIGISGSLINIVSNNIEILNGDYQTYILDMETTDTYTLYNGELNFKIITHNCFPAGTKISLEDGSYKNIEDITTDDVLLTYNNDKKEYGLGKVGTIRVTTQNKLIHLSTANGEEIKSTPRHKIYTQGGWKAAEEVSVGDLLFNKDGELVEVTNTENLDGEFEVYHLIDVKDNHTYFAEDLLVHNLKAGPTCFSAGTRITLSDHSEKFIEDVEVGDEVFGWNGKKLVPGRVIAIDHSHTVNSHAAACKSLGDEPSLYTINETGIEFTPEHPFLTKDGWKSLVPDNRQEPFLSQQEAKRLVVGDYILNNGEWEEIKEIRVVRSNPEEKVYNITVEGVHSYVADGIVVHNK